MPGAAGGAGHRAWRRSIAALVLAWLVVAIPVTIDGPADIEEYYTGAVSTALGVRAVLAGALPFWNLDIGLGMPQPLRFHFLTHPLAGLCAVGDCHMVLRGIASLHVLVGVIFVALIVRRLTSDAMLAGAAGLTFCLSASIVQTLMIDDWPFTALGDAALPVFLYAAMALPVEGSARRTWMWTLVLGGLAGLIISMWFPFRTLLVLALTLLCAPGLRARLPWLVAAAAMAVGMGAGHLFHVYEQFLLTPPGVARVDHADPPLLFHLWSAFARPIPVIADAVSWRSAFIGPPFALAAVIALLATRGPAVRVWRAGLVVSLICWVLPEAYLFNLVTNRWAFRIGVEVFGIVLAAYGLHRWYARSPGTRRWALRAVVAVQLIWIGVAVAPVWYRIAAVTASGEPFHQRRLSRVPGVGPEFEELYAAQPGRVAFSPRATDSLRGFSVPGLGTNQLPLHGVPVLAATASGITSDALMPTAATFITRLRLEPQAFESAPFLDVLGMRHVVAFADDKVAADLVPLRPVGANLQLFENRDAWPEAVAVAALPDGQLPRLPGCPHDRFFCADLSGYARERLADPIGITRIHDGLRLDFQPSDRARAILVTQWWRNGWRVTEGRATVATAAEQLIGVHVEAGESSVTMRFRPWPRMGIFAASLAFEAAVALALLVLCVLERPWRHTP